MGSRERDRHLYDTGEQGTENTNSKDFMIGALVGGLVGGLAALLLAPKSGRELRTTINEQTSGLMDKTEKLRETAMSKGNELASAAKDKAANLGQQSSDLLNKVKGNKGGDHSDPQGDLNDASVAAGDTSSLEQAHPATGDEIQKKLEETQKAFDDTEDKLNQ